MEIKRIFANDLLTSFKYPQYSESEFIRVMEMWRDIEYLEDFFEENKEDLSLWDNISIEEAVRHTIVEADRLEDKLMSLSENIEVGEMDSLFRSLTKMPIERGFEKTKIYNIAKPCWLRIYALKIEKDHYCITGGAIKLTNLMDIRPHTKNELNKLTICKDYLKSEGIFDVDGLLELCI